MAYENLFHKDIGDGIYLISSDVSGPNEDGRSMQPGKATANCYLVLGQERALLFDLAVDESGVKEYAEALAGIPIMTAISHGHYDHVGGVKELVGRYPGLPVYLHPGDTSLTPELCRGLFWTDFYEEGDTLTMDSISFRVLHTPGHTPGSVCLQAGDVLLTGDTLFAGSCGRTDFPGGSWSQMMQSLTRLAELEGDFRVLPGHMEDSTLERERQGNYYLKEAMGKCN